MPLDTLSELSTLLVAVSLATERLVVIVKTLFPKLGAKISAPGGDEDLLDRNRRLLVLGVAYTSALLTTWIIADGWTIEYGTNHRSVSIFGIALLACGGSAFWTQIVGFASAAKDARQVASRRMREQRAPLAPIVAHVPATGGAPTTIPSLPVPPR
jgi:hypothetical protein